MGPNPPCENETFCGDWRGRCPTTEDFFRFLSCARDPLRGSCVSNRSRCGPARIRLSLGEPSAEIVRVEACRSMSKRSRCAPCDFPAHEMAFGSCLVVCAPSFAIPRSRVRLPPGPRHLQLKSLLGELAHSLARSLAHSLTRTH